MTTFSPDIVRSRAKGDRMEARVQGAAYYRAQAEHCRRLAASACHPRLESELLRLAVEFDAEALLAEAEADDAWKRGER
jgi:hypothetical protein